MDPVEREGRIRMIHHLARRYRAQVLVDQALIGWGSLEKLPADGLRKLQSDLYRAYECSLEGLSWEDAGLLKEATG